MNLTIGHFVVWLVVGGVAGTLTGRLVTFKKEGLGRWTNIGVGMVVRLASVPLAIGQQNGILLVWTSDHHNP